MNEAGARLDYDWIVIGSGFGGSVAALRLAEKGYRVAVLECGRRFRDEDFAESTWNLRRYFWMPRLGLRGIFRMTRLQGRLHRLRLRRRRRQPRLRQHALPRRGPPSSATRSGTSSGDWERELAPHYETAERMLGVTDVPARGPRRPPAAGARRGDRRRRHLHAHARRRLLRRAGQEGARPVLRRRGPGRAPAASRCGSCMVGCRYNAKNTLVKNYLWFAEKLGVEILARAHGHRRPPARGGPGRLRRLRGDQRALRRVAAQAAARR